jgi:ABC-type lipoprotein release transport system permease subunit
VRHCLLLDYAAGAELCYASSVPRLAARAAARYGRDLLRGEAPSIIPTGGTSPVGAIGYVEAAFELQEQIAAGALPAPEWIFVPMGSGGTAVGLVLGAKLARSLNASIGSEIVAVVQAADGSLGNEIFTVTGILKTGGEDLDRSAALITREDFGDLFVAPDAIHEIAFNTRERIPPETLAALIGKSAAGPVPRS